MKKLILIWALFILSPCAFAQLPVGLAADLLIRGAKASQNRANKPGQFTAYFKAGSDSVAMKRTPANKMRGDAAAEISQLEAYLTQVHLRYQQPTSAYLCPDAETGAFLIRTITARQPKWDTAPYTAELAFYQGQQRQWVEAARLQEQQARALAQRRAQMERDSLARIVFRRQAYADSIRIIAYAAMARQTASQDSAKEVARVERATELNTALLTPAGRRLMQPAKRATTKPKAGPRVYMCNSGNSVKYHSSSTCRGLSRCQAATVSISKAEAQQTMDACKFCH